MRGFVGAGAVAILAAAFSLRFGSAEMTWSEWFAAVLGGPHTDTSHGVILWAFRGPRVVAALLAGGLLGASGAAFQGLLRNPLAEPYVLGVSSGAGAGGAIAVATGIGAWAGGLGTMALGFVGGAISLGMVLALARRDGRSEPTALILGGVATGALLGAALSCVVLFSGADSSRLLDWLLGSTAQATWPRAGAMAVILVLGLAWLARDAGRLNALAVAGPDAAALGVDVPRVSRRVLFAGTALAAAAVGAIGIVGFVGLVAPHLARRSGGTDWRRGIPLAALYGATILALADLVAYRAGAVFPTVLTGGLPVGVVTAAVGAPWLLFALRRSS